LLLLFSEQLLRPIPGACNEPVASRIFGLKQIPRELTAFEIEAFFTFTATERQVIEQPLYKIRIQIPRRVAGVAPSHRRV
jgi:hypothetical protein